jgi:two-component system response regulator FlrC
MSGAKGQKRMMPMVCSGVGAHHVLLVEDDEDVRGMFDALLQMFGYAVVPVADAEQALEALEVDTFDLVLTDYQLPGINGNDLVRIVHQHDSDVRVILMSGYDELPEIAKACAADAYFAKGCSPMELIPLLQSLVGGD